jgi:hypothetical protein
VKGVTASSSPAVDDGDDDLGHRADEPLDLQDVQPSEIGRAFVLITRAAADALVATGAERPHAVLGCRAVAGQQHAPDVWAHAGVVKGAVQLVHRPRTERVAHLRSVERHPHDAVAHVPVVGDVGEIEPLDGLPLAGVKGV